MYICLCEGVTDHQIRAAVASGVGSYAALRRELGLARQCGRCAIDARREFRDALSDRAAVDEALFYPAAMAAT